MSRFIVGATWDDAPHLGEAAKQALWASYPPNMRDARTKGIPQLGAGAIYPVAESEIVVKNFAIPKHFRRAYGMDAGGGAKPTAACFGALDPDAGVLYIHDVYKRESSEPVVHAEAVKARGAWLPGVGDCAALIMTAHDAEQLIRTYRRLGLDLELPDKAVETGIFDTWTLMSTGRLKVFASCRAWFDEFRLYRRNEKGRIVKANDHIMDAMRYLVRSGLKRAIAEPIVPETVDPAARWGFGGGGGGAGALEWMGR